MVRKRDDMLFFTIAVLVVIVAIFSIGADYGSYYQQGEIYRIRNLNINENIGNEARTVTGYEWGGLKRGVIHTGDGKTTYSQYLVFRELGADPIEAGTVVHEDNEDGVVSDYLKFKEGDDMYEYELIFDEGLEARIDSNGQLRSLENERINILGQEMVFINSRANTAAKSITLEFFGGEILDTLAEGQSEIYMIDGKKYEVRVLIISSSKGRDVVKFIVNGQITDSLTEGETDVLMDGTQIGAKSIMQNEAAEVSGDDIVEFYLGTHRIKMTDNDYTDNEFNSDIRVGNERIYDGRVRIKAFGSANYIVIHSIEYRLKANSYKNDDIYIPKGQGLKEYLKKPQGLLTNRWDIMYGGIEGPVTTSIIDFDSRGDKGYKMSFTNVGGKRYNFPFLDTDGPFKYGDDDNNFIFFEANAPNLPNIQERDYFLVSDGSSHKSQSHIMQFKSADSNILYLEDVAGSTKKVSLKSSSLPGVDTEGQLNIGGNSYRLYVTGGQLAVDQNNDGNINGGEAAITVLGGGIIDLGNNNVPAANFPVTVTTLQKNLKDAPGNEVITINFMDTGGGVDLDVPDQANLKLEKEGKHRLGRAQYSGTLYDMIDDSGANDLRIDYSGGSGGAEVALVLG